MLRSAAANEIKNQHMGPAVSCRSGALAQGKLPQQEKAEATKPAGACLHSNTRPRRGLARGQVTAPLSLPWPHADSVLFVSQEMPEGIEGSR